MSLADLRKDYSLAGLAEKDLAKDPFRQFEKWFQEAEAAKIPEPNAMTLATATREGRPSARTVLLKGLDAQGFAFYTHYDSRKALALAAEVNDSEWQRMANAGRARVVAEFSQERVTGLYLKALADAGIHSHQGHER